MTTTPKLTRAQKATKAAYEETVRGVTFDLAGDLEVLAPRVRGIYNYLMSGPTTDPDRVVQAMADIQSLRQALDDAEGKVRRNLR